MCPMPSIIFAPYDLTNLRAGIEGSRWSAAIFAKNLLNKSILLNNVTLLAVNLPTLQPIRGEPAAHDRD